MIIRSELQSKLNGYEFKEIQQAKEVLSESNDELVNLVDIRRIWERVSVALDHHQENPPTTL